MTHRNVLLLHDNVRVHSAAVTIEAVRQLKFELLAHPPYSPDLAAMGYHVWTTKRSVVWMIF
jgi:transposase